MQKKENMNQLDPDMGIISSHFVTRRQLILHMLQLKYERDVNIYCALLEFFQI